MQLVLQRSVDDRFRCRNNHILRMVITMTKHTNQIACLGFYDWFFWMAWMMRQRKNLQSTPVQKNRSDKESRNRSFSDLFLLVQSWFAISVVPCSPSGMCSAISDREQSSNLQRSSSVFVETDIFLRRRCTVLPLIWNLTLNV